MDDAEPPPDDGAPPSVPRAELFDAFFGDRVLPAEFDGSKVPPELMRLPIELAIEWLEAHRQSCKNKKGCPDTPPTLRWVLRASSVKVIASNTTVVHQALWKNPRTRMVRMVRGETRRRLAETVDAIDDGSAFDAEWLLNVARNPAAMADLVAGLWATMDADRKAAPSRRDLFRILPALVEGHDTQDKPVRTPRPADERAKKKVAELRERLANAERQLRETQADRNRVKRDLARSSTAAGELSLEVERLRHDLERTSTELAEQTKLARDAESASQQASRTNRSLRESVQRLERSETSLEATRASLVRELAVLRSQQEALTAEFAALPRGADAVHEFLQAEETRIDEEYHTREGAAKERSKIEHRNREKLEDAFFEAYPDYRQPRPVAPVERRPIAFTALGGGDEVGRSCYLLEVGTSRVLVDCGIAVGKDIEGMAPPLDEIGRLDAVIVTHAHTDHIGWLPALVARQADPVSIYCTEDTSEIMPVMLADSRKHYVRQLAERRRLARFSNADEDDVEAYTEDDIRTLESRLRTQPFATPFRIRGTGLDATFHWAGHILGAASVLIQGGGRTVLLSGDISSEHQEKLAPAKPPEVVHPIDLLVLESTYGGQTRGPHHEARADLVEFVANTVKRGVAILPCFALGRAQEVIEILLAARERGELDENFTIWVDGMINKINPTYQRAGILASGGFEPITSELDRAMAVSSCQRPDGRGVVVTTSGMLNGGPVLDWIEALLHDGRHRLALLGYQDEGALGGAARRLARQNGRPPFWLDVPSQDGDSPRRLKIDSAIQEISLSAHADRNGLVAYASSVQATNIALVHGEPRAQRDLAEALRHACPHATVHAAGNRRLELT